MKSKINIFLFAIVFSCISFANAQEEQLDSSIKTFVLINKDVISNQNNGVDITKSANKFLQNNNLIHISQIGFYNHSNVTVNNENSKMIINQNGVNNYLEVYKNANELNQFVMQSGNNNFVSDFSLYSASPINMSISQDGNNLSLYNNGSNSISKDLKITQTGNSGTIYIFNH